MGLQIGFAKKYYTLWSVSSEDVYSSFEGLNRKVGVKTHYCYIQNLSTDLDKAKSKAELKGVEDLTVNDDLYGRSNSWTDYVKVEKEEVVVPADVFAYGKYEGQNINKCTDVNYMTWYIEDRDKKSYDKEAYAILAKRIVELDNTFYLQDVNGVSKLASISDKVLNDIINGKREVVTISNFKYEEHYDEYTIKVNLSEVLTDADECFISKYPYGLSIAIDAKDLDLQRRYYNGYNYYVPKGLRSFKNKTITLSSSDVNTTVMTSWSWVDKLFNIKEV